MPKKITAVLMLIVLCVGLCACGEKQNTVTNPKNSDLAVVDTQSGFIVYITQDRAEIQKEYGNGSFEAASGSIAESYNYFGGQLTVYYDANDKVERIMLFKSPYFKTFRGLKYKDGKEQFKKLYEYENRATEDTYTFEYNGETFEVSATFTTKEGIVDYISVRKSNLEFSESVDYGSKADLEDSDLTIIDTQTGKKIYFGQSKEEVEKNVGEGSLYDTPYSIQYDDDLIIDYDDQKRINKISFSNSTYGNDSLDRYTTNRGFGLGDSKEEFFQLYGKDNVTDASYDGTVLYEYRFSGSNGVNYRIYASFQNKDGSAEFIEIQDLSPYEE